MLSNAIRGHLAEFGIIAAQGPVGVTTAIKAFREADAELPELMKSAIGSLITQLQMLAEEIAKIETRILTWHRNDPTSRRLASIPGIGPITASAIAASVPDMSPFRSGRQFAAWLGLTPRANSSGGKERQAGISKQGDGYLRRLLVIGATAILRFARKNTAGREWAVKLLARKRPKVAAVALANKTARIAWAVVSRNEFYKPVGA
jgi:transposase